MPVEDHGRLRRGSAVSPWLVGALVLAALVVLANTLPIRWALTVWSGSVLLALFITGLYRRRGGSDTQRRAILEPGSPHEATGPAVELPAPPIAGPGARDLRASDVPATMPMVMTADETAQYLRIDSTEVVAAIGAGQFPGNRIGEHWRVRSDSILAWLDGPYVAPRKPTVPRRRTPPSAT